MLTMGKQSNTPAGRRYVVRTMAFMGGYVAVMLATIGGAFDAIQGKPAAWALALAVSAPIAGQIWATLSFMRDSDEYVRAVTAKQFIVAAGVAMALFSAWGFGESFAGAPHAEGWLIYPLFWAIFGCVAPMVRSSN
jgi:putative oxidoreductase